MYLEFFFLIWHQIEFMLCLQPVCHSVLNRFTSGLTAWEEMQYTLVITLVISLAPVYLCYCSFSKYYMCLWDIITSLTFLVDLMFLFLVNWQWQIGSWLSKEKERKPSSVTMMGKYRGTISHSNLYASCLETLDLDRNKSFIIHIKMHKDIWRS